MTFRNTCFRLLAIIPIGMTLTGFACAETVGVFFDLEIKQSQFAASDVKVALERKKITVEMFPLDSLNSVYANKKVVIASGSNDAVVKSLDSHGSTNLPHHMAIKYPEVPPDELFSAWDKASSGLPKLGGLITGTLGRDNQWWPEACQSNTAFLTVADFGDAKVTKVSKLASIADTAAGELDGQRSAYLVADEMETDAKAALALVDTMTAGENKQLEVSLNNIRNKVLPSLDLPNWHAHDAAVLKEFTDPGGISK